MEAFRFNDIWQFIQSQNSHMKTSDLAIGSILGGLAGATLAVLIALRVHREAWSADLFLLSALCCAGIGAFLVYGGLALGRGRESSPRKTGARRDPA
jgi:hypothetical protein